MLIDAHAHLDRYGLRLPAALEELERLGILTIAVSMEPSAFQHVLELSAHCDLVVPAFGIHPWNAHKYADSLEALEPLIARSPLLGEIGLDHHFVKDPARHDAQRAVLEHFLKAARQQDKLVNLHTKGAEAEVADLLETHTIGRAIVHWYSGSVRVLERLLDHGAYVTVGVEVLRSRRLQAIARALPADHLLRLISDDAHFAPWHRLIENAA